MTTNTSLDSTAHPVSYEYCLRRKDLSRGVQISEEDFRRCAILRTTYLGDYTYIHQAVFEDRIVRISQVSTAAINELLAGGNQ